MIPGCLYGCVFVCRACALTSACVWVCHEAIHAYVLVSTAEATAAANVPGHVPTVPLWHDLLPCIGTLIQQFLPPVQNKSANLAKFSRPVVMPERRD